MWIIAALFVTHWVVSCFFQSSFHHRYASHRMFTMSARAEKVWHLLAYAAQGPSYLSPRAYAELHREHHAYSDAERVPQARVFFPNSVAMMWETPRGYTAHLPRGSSREGRSPGHCPDWPPLERRASRWTSRIIWG